MESNKRTRHSVFQAERRSGFTFAELLAAMVFIAIAIPVILEGIAIANRSAVFSERKLAAAQLAETLLQEMVLTESWLSAANEGHVEKNRVSYRWQVQLTPWQDTPVRQLTVIVFFPVQGKEYNVHLSTLVVEEEESA